MFTDEEVAQVTKIQAMARGRAVRLGQARSARSRASGRGKSGATTPLSAEDEVGYTEEEMQALIKIQAAARGRATRATLKAMKEEELTRQLFEQGGDDAGAGKVQLSEEELAGLDALLGEFSVEEEEKIVQIQAVARGRADRLKAKKLRMAAKAEESAGADAAAAAGNEAEDIPEMLFSDDEIRSITKIQAAARGRAVRRNDMNARITSEAVKAVKEDESGDAGVYTAEDEAQIIKIQAAARGRAVRKAKAAGKPVLEPSSLTQLEFTTEEMESITKIQAVARGRKVRAAQAERARVAEEVEALRNLGAVEEEDQAEELPSAEDYTSEEQAAIVRIQAAARGRSERKRMVEMKQMSGKELAKAKAENADLVIELTAEEEEKITKIQAVARGRQARREAAALMADFSARQAAEAQQAAKAKREGLNPRKYLDEYLVKGVRRALSQLVVDRPADPFDYLANLIEAQAARGRQTAM